MVWHLAPGYGLMWVETNLNKNRGVQKPVWYVSCPVCKAPPFQNCRSVVDGVENKTGHMLRINANEIHRRHQGG